ncbi:hypothetical protein LEP1GSC040_1026 [Leptospira santarosai str. 2000030832]|nr:hypothetical protein LEP1GSC040_1026 [Leptospira santarosai str. 2000030832]
MRTIDEIGFSGLDRTNTFRRFLDDKLKNVSQNKKIAHQNSKQRKDRGGFGTNFNESLR